jgi:hypothetical protein
MEEIALVSIHAIVLELVTLDSTVKFVSDSFIGETVVNDLTAVCTNGCGPGTCVGPNTCNCTGTGT